MYLRLNIYVRASERSLVFVYDSIINNCFYVNPQLPHAVSGCLPPLCGLCAPLSMSVYVSEFSIVAPLRLSMLAFQPSLSLGCFTPLLPFSYMYVCTCISLVLFYFLFYLCALSISARGAGESATTVVASFYFQQNP